jgi:hypothetical protein
MSDNVTILYGISMEMISGSTIESSEGSTTKSPTLVVAKGTTSLRFYVGER